MNDDERPRLKARVGTAFDPQLRYRLELVGLGLSVLLAIGMGGFLLADWARAFFPIAETIFDQYLVIGEWIDYFLGTSVFWIASSWRAFATGVFIGIAAPIIGVFLIHRQMALIGETLAHTAFAGVAAGVILVALTGWRGNLFLLDLGSQGALLLVALVVSALGAFGLQWLTEQSETYGDVPIAIVLAGSFAIGTLLISWGRDRAPIAVDIEGFLFGSVAIVTAQGARLVALLTVVIVLLVLYNYKQFVFVTFDQQAASVAGLRVGRLNQLLIVMTAVVVVGAMQILGVILVAAMLVVPAATASQVAGSFRETMYLSVIFGQLSVLLGLGFSIGSGLPPGGSIVVAAIAWYLIALALTGVPSKPQTAY